MINDLTMVFNPITQRSILLFASWVIFHASFGRLLIFFKINFFEKIFQEYHLSVKQIGSRRLVRPDLGPNCLQKLSAYDTKR